LQQPVSIFLGRAKTDLRISTCTHAAGCLLSNGDSGFHPGFSENLLIRIDDQEFHAAQMSINHAIDCIHAATADSNHFDQGR
jgi:hypothetical protein